MKEKEWNIKISFNSPTILWFAILCLIALLLNQITRGLANDYLFSVYRSSLLNPLTYVRLFGHVLGHAGWNHFVGNITLILVVGPLLEEKYGSWNILFVILITALVTGVFNVLLFSHTQLLGASGVVFAFILLSSITSSKEGTIPLTFLLVALIYIGGQIYQGLFVKDQIANFTHILGGSVGAVLGFVMNKREKRTL